MLKRRLKLPQQLNEMDALISKFLASQGFPDNQAYRGMAASFLQQAADGEDSFNVKSLAKRIRRQVANECLFYIMYPNKREEYEKAKAASEANSEAPQTVES